MNIVIENKSLTIKEVKKKTDALENKVKFQSFGKTKPATAAAKKRRLEERKEAATGMDDKEARKLLHIQSQTIEDEINKIKSGRHGRVTNVFKMREVVAGSKKQQQEAHAVKDTKTGQTVVLCEEIRRVNLEHCVNVLKNNIPKPEVEVLLKCQSELHELMMKEDTDMDTTITEEEYKEVVAKFKKKNKKSYFFLTKAGDIFPKSIYKLCKRMIEEEHFPSDFSLTVLYQLWKRKGSREDLNNHRYIHMKDWLPRLTEALTVSLMKDDVLSGGNKFQIGGIPGHRVEEHLIVVKAVIQLQVKRKSGVILQLVDIEKFFDSEILRTIMTSLNEANINKKAYRCWFRLNEKTQISVATPAGTTETADVEEIVAQGSGGAELASGLDIDRGLESQFSGSIDEISYGCVRLQPLAYQDDIARLASTVNSAMMDQKGLRCHPTKTVCIAIGSNKYRENIKSETESHPVMFGSFKVKFVSQEVYLGDVISAQGLEDSIQLTIERRAVKVRGAMYETNAIMEDFRMQAVGGMAGAWDLWETAMIPSLLANCGSWVGMGKKSYNLLNELQYTYSV